jgi:TatD DNase family protein
MIIDSHCHLEYEPMYSQLSEVVQRGIDNNVKYFLSISTTDSSFQKILKIIDQHQSIYGTWHSST